MFSILPLFNGFSPFPIHYDACKTALIAFDNHSRQKRFPFKRVCATSALIFQLCKSGGARSLPAIPKGSNKSFLINRHFVLLRQILKDL